MAFAADAFDAVQFAVDAFVSVIAAGTSLAVVAAELIAFQFEAFEFAAAALMNYSSSSDYSVTPVDIDLRDSDSMAESFDCSLLVELVVAHYLTMTCWTSTMFDSENWAVLEGSFVDALRMSAVDAYVLHFAYESAVEFSLARAAETAVEVLRSMAVADEHLENVTLNAIDGRQQPFCRLYSDKFDRDNLIELMIDAGTLQQRQPSVPPTALEDYLSS